MDGPIHRFRVGTFRCTVLSDGGFVYSPRQFFANADATELAAALSLHGLEGDRIYSPYACLLVDTGRHLVLLDTGGEGWDPGVGRLRESLAAAGVEPGQVDVVVLTHGHPDHIGGTAGADGRPVFGNAAHIMAPAEWRFWTSEDTLARVPEAFRRIAMENLPPIADRLRLVEGEADVVPGIRVLPTPGHTPGHLAVIVEDGGEELLYVSDAVLHPIGVQHPDWCPYSEVDLDQAIASRRMLLDRAARSGSLVHAYHFDPFPCLGHVTKAREGWHWEPLPVREQVIA